MNRLLKVGAKLLVLTGLLLVPGFVGLALAATQDPNTPPDLFNATYLAVMAAVTAFVPFVTYGFRNLIAKYGPTLPRILIPFVAMLFSGPVLAEIMSYVGLLVGVHPFWGGILAGALGIVVREIWNTWDQWGWST